jgi:hypothetical protein
MVSAHDQREIKQAELAWHEPKSILQVLQLAAQMKQHRAFVFQRQVDASRTEHLGGLNEVGGVALGQSGVVFQRVAVSVTANQAESVRGQALQAAIGYIAVVPLEPAHTIGQKGARIDGVAHSVRRGPGVDDIVAAMLKAQQRALPGNLDVLHLVTSAAKRRANEFHRQALARQTLIRIRRPDVARQAQRLAVDSAHRQCRQQQQNPFHDALFLLRVLPGALRLRRKNQPPLPTLSLPTAEEHCVHRAGGVLCRVFRPDPR